MTTNKDFREFQQYMEDVRNLKSFFKYLEENNTTLEEVDQLDEGFWDSAIGKGLKFAGKAVGPLSTALMGYETYKRIKSGDYPGAALSGAAMIPGPIGWAAIGADYARGDKSEEPKTSAPEQPKTSAPEQPKSDTTPLEPKKVQSINIPTPITPKVVKSTVEKESGGKEKMSDKKKKSISEALAEVQRNVNISRERASIEMMEDNLNEANPLKIIGSLFGKGAKAAKASPKVVTPLPASTVQMPTTPKGKTGPQTITGTVNPPPPPTPPKTPTTGGNVPAIPPSSGPTLKGVVKGVLGAGAAAGLGYGAYKGAEYLMGKDKEAPKTQAPETPDAKPSGETPKTQAPEKMTFKQAFAKARQAAAEKGSKTTGQFEWEGKKYQTNIQGTGTAKKPQEKYVSMSKQTKVDVGSPQTSTAPVNQKPQKEPNGPPMPTTQETPKPASITPTPDMLIPKPYGQPETFKKQQTVGPNPNTFSTESGKRRKMSEEYENEINEGDFIRNQPTGGGNYPIYRKSSKPATSFQKSYGAAKPGSTFNWQGRPYAKPGATTTPPATSQSSIQPKTSTNQSWADPGKLDYSDPKKGNMNPTVKPDTGYMSRDSERDPARGVQRLPGGGEKGVGTPGGTLSLERPAGSDTPKTSASDTLATNRPRLGQGNDIGASASDNVQKLLGNRPMTSTGTPSTTPSAPRPVTSTTVNDTNKRPVGPSTSFSTESGKKKIKESTGNPLIDSFLALQETKAGNVFEAAKKMKKANDGNLANNYPPYDKVTRGDVIAGRLGKDEMGGKRKVHEASRYDGKNPFDSKDPSVQGSGDLTVDKVKTKPAPKSDFSAVTKDDKPYVSPESKKAGMGVREEFDLESFIEECLIEGYDINDIIDYLDENFYLDESAVELINQIVYEMEMFENVSFSDDELAYFDAVMEAKAPEAPEENMSDGISSKMDRKTLTDSKKVK